MKNRKKVKENTQSLSAARKAVVRLLIMAVLLPVFCIQKVYANPGDDLQVTKTVYRDTAIIGDGSGNGASDYQQIFEGDTTVAHTNVLKYSYEIQNTGAYSVTVDLTANMPTNTVFFFDYQREPDRMLTGPMPAGGNDTLAYEHVDYAWWTSAFPYLNEYQRSLAAAAHGSFTVTLDGVEIEAGDSYIFEYAVIVWAENLTGYAIVDDFYMDTVLDTIPPDPFTLYFFNPQLSLTADKTGTVSVGEEVEYTLGMTSVGTQAVMELEIPAGTTYKPGSLDTGLLLPYEPPDVWMNLIGFTLTGIPLGTEFFVRYTVTVNAGTVSVNNTQTEVNGTAFNSVSLNVVSGSVVASDYSSDVSPSLGITAGQKITYTANVSSVSGSLPSASVSVTVPPKAAFISAAGSNYYYDTLTGQLSFSLLDLDTTGVGIGFTLELTDGAYGDLDVHFDGMGTPSAWKHPILAVTKSLEKDTYAAVGGVPGFSEIQNGASVKYTDLIKFIYTVQNTGTLPVTGMALEAPTPDKTALYITYMDPSVAFGDSGYWDTGIMSNGTPVTYGYGELAYGWAFEAGSDYERSVEAEERNNPLSPGVYYGPFAVYKYNMSLLPQQTCDFRYAAFVNSDIIGTEFHDEFSVNGVPTKPVRLLIPGYEIPSDPPPFSSVAVGNYITYTFTKPSQTAAVFDADIPTGTSLVSWDAVPGVTVTASVDKITLGVSSGLESVSYTVRAERPVKVIVNNVNVNGVYLGTVTHNMAAPAPGVVLGYTFTSHLNNNYIGYGDSMTFKFYVQNNTDHAIENVVVTVPVNENLRLNLGSIPYWFGDDAVIILNDGTAHNSYDLQIDPLFDYDAEQPVSVRWKIPYIEAGHTVSALINQTDPASEISFSGNVKNENEIPRETGTLEQTASLTFDGAAETVNADPLLYYFQPRAFISLTGGEQATVISSPSGELLETNGPEYKYGDVISYTVLFDHTEAELAGAAELFISSTVPAGAALEAGSVEVLKKVSGDWIPCAGAVIDLDNPGKIRVRIPYPEGADYSINYSVKITGYKGRLKTYAIGQILSLNNGKKEATAASETNILQHDFTTPLSTVTINRQSLADAAGTELNTIPQSVNGALCSLPVDFVITFTVDGVDEYNAVMRNGDTGLVFYGLPYDVPISVTETGTSDTFFKMITASSGGDGGVTLDNGKYSFILRDTDTERNISFSIVSEYRPVGGFSSAASRSNPFKIPNFDFTGLLKYQLQDLASTQIDNGPGDGAIPISDDALSYNFATQRFSVRPYFSMTAANAFLLDPAYYENTKRYIEWHIEHLNIMDYYEVPGSVYDYYYSLIGDERRAYTMAESDNTVDVYDSTDSYAALFLELLVKYYEATGDDDFITPATLDLVLDCLEASFSSSPLIQGNALLTVAKPKNYEIEFLMDNCEVYRGFLSLEKLYMIIGDSYGAADAADYAARILLGIETYLYDSVTGTYDYALDNPSDIETYYYPDAIAQLFPIIFNVIPKTSAAAEKVYGDFQGNFPYWTDMTNLDRAGETPKINRGGGASEFPNALILKAAIKMGDLTGASTGLKNIEKLFRQNGNPFPFLCYESGETALCIFDFMNAYYRECGEVFTAVQKFQSDYVSY